MQKRMLPGSGVAVSVVGIGGWQIGGLDKVDGIGHGWSGVDDQHSIDVIHRAEEYGVNLIDTADIYGNGHSEHIIGKALQGRRDRWCVATKGGLVKKPEQRGQYFDGSARHIAQAIDDSLVRLRTDYIDFYQLHGMPRPDQMADTVAILEAAKNSGKIRFYGISTDRAEHIVDMKRYGSVDIVQLAMNITTVSHAGFSYCYGNDIATFIRSPLAWGKAFGKYAQEVPDFPFGDVRHGVDKSQLRFEHQQGLAFDFLWNKETGRTPVQAVLRYLIDTPGVGAVIPGTKNIEHLLDNIGAGDCAPISESEWVKVRAAKRQALTAR